jgi:RHS repeat-associated protein
VIWRESYQPYGGRTRNEAAAAENKVWFTSRRQDAETGLVYMGARYYDPVVGRFVSTDPAGFDERNLHSFNRYAYANNNPYKYLDPDGKSPAHVLRGVGQGSYWAATRLGAKEVGERLGLALWILTSNSDSESGAKGARSGETSQSGDDGEARVRGLPQRACIHQLTIRAA